VTHDHNIRARREDSEIHDFNPMLDAALARYAAVDPRDGLEERVLANLRANKQRQSISRSWLAWSAVAVAAAAVIVATVVLTSRSERPIRGIARQNITVAPETRESANVQIASNSANESAHASQSVSKKSRPAHSAAKVEAKVEAIPKLDQFPSPQPLTEQEQILSMYVSRFHRQAVLLAEVRAAELQKDRAEDARKWRALSASDLQQLNQETTKP
jgi:hypothetical protein